MYPRDSRRCHKINIFRFAVGRRWRTITQFIKPSRDGPTSTTTREDRHWPGVGISTDRPGYARFGSSPDDLLGPVRRSALRALENGYWPARWALTPAFYDILRAKRPCVAGKILAASSALRVFDSDADQTRPHVSVASEFRLSRGSGSATPPTNEDPSGRGESSSRWRRAIARRAGSDHPEPPWRGKTGFDGTGPSDRMTCRRGDETSQIPRGVSSRRVHASERGVSASRKVLPTSDQHGTLSLIRHRRPSRAADSLGRSAEGSAAILRGAARRRSPSSALGYLAAPHGGVARRDVEKKGTGRRSGNASPNSGSLLAVLRDPSRSASGGMAAAAVVGRRPPREIQGGPRDRKVLRVERDWSTDKSEFSVAASRTRRALAGSVKGMIGDRKSVV